MPPSNRKKRSIPATKRLQVTDDDGWTHVTSGSNVRRVLRKAQTQPGTHLDLNLEPVLGPSEAPGHLTLSELQKQYEIHRARWVESETWGTLAASLDERMRDLKELGAGLDAIVCIGLGSPSGFLRDGWVDRRSIVMYQLAALESITQRLSRLETNIPSFPIYAQDPVFNTLDRALLDSIGVTVLDSPAGFERITSNSLLFCPGAERKHLELVLPSNPRFVFGGPLENTASEVIQGFVEKMGSRLVVPFMANEHAFWKTRLYFRVLEELES
ncbi:hypothetical protein N7495_000851 [Penicillium taxi]|uniref:uncharacterized protein n=1 Tax=Penicillium taxi TaxID=168475 RepID=UPI002544F479|nr:uncharacterized protein N7495_000851 [Penicillium taxi]KAJ5908169.1 hypothetical protein N7495_000851 [Penicillium taxi]